MLGESGHGGSSEQLSGVKDIGKHRQESSEKVREHVKDKEAQTK